MKTSAETTHVEMEHDVWTCSRLTTVCVTETGLAWRVKEVSSNSSWLFLRNAHTVRKPLIFPARLYFNFVILNFLN